MATKLQRTAFETSRLLEFFDAKELQMQIGHGKEMWPLALVKELIDNGLDACESADIAPVITIDVDIDAVSVADNGPGLPASTLRRSLDYSVRVSDKRHYVAPTRGQLGNALKTVWAAPFAINGERGKTEVWTGGTHYTIEVTLDRIAQAPALELEEEPADVKNGTIVKMHWHDVASYLHDPKWAYYYKPVLRDLIPGYTLCNPHLSISLVDEGVEWTSTDPTWRKWTATEPTSPHWYTVEDLRNLAAAYLAAGANKTVREFVSEFRGLSGTAKQKRVVDAADLSGQTLADLVVGGDIDTSRLGPLLAAMKAESRAPKPALLGVIGEGHFRSWMKVMKAADDSVVYRKSVGEVDGLPYVLEMAFGVSEHNEEWRRCASGLNWTPSLKVPFSKLDELMGKCRVDRSDPAIVAVHLACPKLAFTDRGKSQIDLPDAILEDFEKAFVAITKQWTKAKNQAARQERLSQRQLEEIRKQQRRDEWTIKDACYAVMGDAYAEASSNGRYPANARQVMYAARRLVTQMGVDFYKNSASFTQGVLPEYQNDFPEETADWDIVYDDRGHLIEPHTQQSIGLGTLAVRRYVRGWTNGAIPRIEAPSLATSIDTSGPYNRYGAVLFVEKEGFNEVLKAARIAERYDIAIQSTKGQTVTAARQLAEHYAERGIRIFVLHDFDKSGIEIVANYEGDTRRYQYDTRPLITDIGLRLADVKALGIEVSGAEDVEYKSEVNPSVNLKACGATTEEVKFLVRGGWPRNWHGMRVELNALTSEQFIHFIERKLEEHGVQKVVPKDDKFLAAAYKRAVIVARLQKKIDEIFPDMADENVDIPKDLHQRLAATLEGTGQSWDDALFDLATEEL